MMIALSRRFVFRVPTSERLLVQRFSLWFQSYAAINLLHDYISRSQTIRVEVRARDCLPLETIPSAQARDNDPSSTYLPSINRSIISCSRPHLPSTFISILALKPSICWDVSGRSSDPRAKPKERRAYPILFHPLRSFITSLRYRGPV